ncbi:ubiquinol-cytochrome c reductase iron-sulfur subunit [Calothrix sp. UHCC 0171]|uniref:QcrA and Rieske domain-containing protein n=1 Tax=Calothrix sp. UHCC 0171 TaxID=3110245 RepID=UPI002B20120B|nr:ubiquinol-cytochrome c reductase iron-sulfur subunit [Calothrix sp. UHCC 0171]MEA5571171.1 ubiquinol-cytochrome c reductase iron-sulfur subunit [Calothrix sp. UHCC 0171]
MNRRDFITLFGIGGIASSLPLAIAACSPEKSTTTVSQDWQNIGTVAELDKTGQLLNENSPVGKVLVVGTSKANNIVAVNPTCTHKGCKVDWKATENKFLCPCHQSAFAGDGKVLEGPATKPLATYAVKIEGDAVFAKPA